jgi:D-alanyl-D-alanine dipeptidase
VGSDLFARCRHGLEFRALSKLPFLQLDLRYAGTGNLCGRDLYRGEREAWLHQEALEALLLSAQALAEQRPGWRFRIFDAARPVSVQRELFAKVAGTPRQAYVADPDRGSVHNFGFALDLGLQDERGEPLDMGTPFDSFEPLAQPQLETAFVAQGKLDAQQVAWRQILRDVMARGGFRQHALEWWHFDLKPLEELRGKYPLLDA